MATTYPSTAIVRRGNPPMSWGPRGAGGRRNTTAPEAPVESSIDPAPLDAALAMKGVVIGGAYRAAVGVHTLLRGEDLGGEMGMTTWVSVAGTNGHAIAHGEFVAGTDDLQRVLKALRVKGISVTSIRNHTLGEEPQLVFVHFRGEGTALDLARAVRYVLNAQRDESQSSPNVLELLAGPGSISGMPFP